MTELLIPLLFASVMLYAVTKKVSVYDSFVAGAKEAINLTLSLFPYIASIMICIELFKTSGLSEVATDFSEPFLKVFGIPKELLEMLILRPLSGSGSLALLENVFTEYGVDSFISRAAAVIVGSSDTTFYIAGVYFSGTGVKSLRYGIPVALISTFLGSVFSCWICSFL